MAIATDSPDDSGNWVTTVTSETEVPPDFFSHLMGFQYMQTVLMVFLLVAFLLNLGGGPVTPDLLSAYQVEGFLEWASSFFGAVPIGFLLAMFLGLLAFGISGAFRLARSLFRS